jgi:hypothetical protein
MLRNWKKSLAAVVMLALAPGVVGFTPLGPGGGEGIPGKLWQLPAANAGWDIGYNLAGDIGAPVYPTEAYRWNIPVLTYGFTESFLGFFGTNGVKAIDSAIRILNDLPPVSTMSEDLSEFPLNSAHVNHEAAQLGLIDLKSIVLPFLLEEMGLTDSIRWVYAISFRIPFPPGSDFGIYSIIKNNYDPVTLSPSSYVNGTLWTYSILEIPPPVQFSDALEELPPGINQEVNIPVTSLTYFPGLSGYFFTGLTRDDVGGLRYLYTPRNIVGEALLTGTAPGSGVWSPFIGTNALAGNTNNVGTNALATAGKRGGVNKIRFQKVHYDSTFFAPFAQTYKDRVVFQGEVFEQSVVRTVILPDIIFDATDLRGAVIARETTANWVNNELLNGGFANGGPGVITPPIFIALSKTIPTTFNQTPFFVTEPFLNDTNSRPFGLFNFTWASFDGTTNAPIIYPQYLNYTIDTVRNQSRGNVP